METRLSEEHQKMSLASLKIFFGSFNEKHFL
jgi:hypothetical protein